MNGLRHVFQTTGNDHDTGTAGRILLILVVVVVKVIMVIIVIFFRRRIIIAPAQGWWGRGLVESRCCRCCGRRCRCCCGRMGRHGTIIINQSIKSINQINNQSNQSIRIRQGRKTKLVVVVVNRSRSIFLGGGWDCQCSGRYGNRSSSRDDDDDSDDCCRRYPSIHPSIPGRQNRVCWFAAFVGWFVLRRLFVRLSPCLFHANDSGSWSDQSFHGQDGLGE